MMVLVTNVKMMNKASHDYKFVKYVELHYNCLFQFTGRMHIMMRRYYHTSGSPCTDLSMVILTCRQAVGVS